MSGSKQESRPVSPAGKPARVKKLGLRLFRAMLTILFAVVVLVLVGVIFFFIRYEKWERENAMLLNTVAVEDTPDRQIVQKDLYDKLQKFNSSVVQREVLVLDCAMMNVLVEDVALENWDIPRYHVGIECGKRAIDVYVKTGGWWFVVNIWQRSEGSVNFAVYDVLLGPFSVAELSLGSVSGDVTKGVEDAIRLVMSDSYSGRKIEEMYIDTDRIRIVGVLADTTEEG